MADGSELLFAKLGLRPGLLIDGRWQDGSGGNTLIRNPATGSGIATTALAGPADFQRAIDGAQRAFLAWRNESAAWRGEVLKRVAALLASRRTEMAELLTSEQGKPLAQALGEVDYAASFFQWFGEESRRLCGRIQPHPVKGRDFVVKPVAAGCTAVWKPSELTPLVALALGALLKEAGLPDGALQVLPALGAVGGEALTSDGRVRVLSLTGSTETGRTVMRAAARHLPRLSLELGGNAPFIVLPDADLDLAAAELVKLKMLCSGQVCVTANRVFVPEALEAAFIDRLIPLWRALRIGSGLTPGMDAGPLIHGKACERVGRQVEGALGAGAERVCENRDHEGDPALRQGSFFPPVILRKVRDDMALVREEIFGPVLPLLKYDTVADAVRRANSTAAGLAAYVYGTDLSLANAVADQVEAGIIGINEWRPLRAEIPFGGTKESGLGWEGGEEGLWEFCELKVISTPRASIP